MKIIEKKLELEFNINKFFNYENKDIVIFDIETTGFSPVTSYLYLIGYIVYDGSSWIFKQLFAESTKEDKLLINAFYEDIKNYKAIFHFNGDTFDLPYVRKKSTFDIFSHLNSHDIYKISKPYKKVLNMDRMNLKSIEKFLGIYREDEFHGGQLISQYFEYLRTKKLALYKNLLLHNEEDLINMFKVMDILHYDQTFTKIASNDFTFKEYNVDSNAINIVLDVISPFNLNYKRDGYNFTFRKNSNVTVCIDIIDDTLKYFLENYKDYYYLPDSSEIILKTIGVNISPAKRENAKKNNCYINHSSKFIRIFNKHNKTFYKNKEMYVELCTHNLKQIIAENVINIIKVN